MVNSKKIIARYRELKQKAPDCILLVQVGAFMQVMDNDAKALSQLTGLKLQMECRDALHASLQNIEIPMR